MIDYRIYLSDENPSDKYQIQNELGSGSYGKVWCATNKRTGRFVAIKKPVQNNGDIYQRFCNEIDFYQRMSDSPFVVKMLDSNTNSFDSFLVTEFCNLGSARSRMWELNLNRTRTIGLLAQLAHALSDVHNRGMLHRDIKPDNLLLKTDEQNLWSLKLGDPGLACFPATSAFDFGATRTVRGTEFYIAPELGYPRAIYTKAADAYSFGVTAVEMLSGHRPSANTLIQDYSVNLNNLLSKLISSDPRIRPNMSNVVRELVLIHQQEIQKTRIITGVGLGAAILGIYFLTKKR